MRVLAAAARLLLLLTVNVALFAVLFAALEIGMRIHRDGVRGTVAALDGRVPAPYSNLGTGNWVVYDPELGYRLNPARAGIDARSVRNGPIVVPKPAGRFRMIVLGDSIPWDVPGFVDELAATLRPRGDVEVVNASVPGYTAYQEARFFARELGDTEPDLVVWTYCLNDNHRFLHEFDAQAHMLFTREARESLAIRSWWDWVVSRSYVLSTLRAGWLARRDAAAAATSRFPWESRPDFNVAWKPYSWRLYEEQLRAVLHALAPSQGRLAIVAFPYEPQLQLRARRADRDEILEPQRRLAGLCARYGVPYLDLYPGFERAYDAGAILYRDGIHLNPEGHHATAAAMLRFLDDEGLLPPAAAR